MATRERSVPVDAAGVRQPERCSDDKAQKAIDDYDALTLRTSDFLRKIVLFDSRDEQKTELADLPKGSFDPRLQLILVARDAYLSAESEKGKAAFLGTMRSLLSDVVVENAKRIEARAAVLEANKDRLLKATLATKKDDGPTLAELMTKARKSLEAPAGN